MLKKFRTATASSPWAARYTSSTMLQLSSSGSIRSVSASATPPTHTLRPSGTVSFHCVSATASVPTLGSGGSRVHFVCDYSTKHCSSRSCNSRSLWTHSISLCYVWERRIYCFFLGIIQFAYSVQPSSSIASRDYTVHLRSENIVTVFCFTLFTFYSYPLLPLATSSSCPSG